MSQESRILVIPGMTAGEDLSADVSPTASKRYRFVKLDGADPKEVLQVTNGAADIVIGVLGNLPELAKSAQVTSFGTAKVRAGAAVVAGVRVKSDNGGKAVTGGGGGDRNWGIALEAASADGSIFEILLTGLIVT